MDEYPRTPRVPCKLQVFKSPTLAPAQDSAEISDTESIAAAGTDTPHSDASIALHEPEPQASVSQAAEPSHPAPMINEPMLLAFIALNMETFQGEAQASALRKCLPDLLSLANRRLLKNDVSKF